MSLTKGQSGEDYNDAEVGIAPCHGKGPGFKARPLTPRKA